MNDKIKRILDNRESKLIETINTLEPECMYAIAHYIGYKESEYINIIEEQDEKYKKSCETYQKARGMIRFIAYNSERPLTITELNKVYNILGGDDNE